MAEKRDRMIAAGRFTAAQIAKAVGSTEQAIEKYIYRQKKGFGHSGHSIVRAPSHNVEEAGPECPESPTDVPSTPAGVRAELQRMLKCQKEMETALKDDGPQAMPAILAILGEQRKTIEAILKAEVVFANMPAGAQETPQQRAAEIRAYFSKLIEGAPPEVRDWILKRMTGESRQRAKEQPEISEKAPEKNDDCRKEGPK
jgi:hypothetical protein